MASVVSMLIKVEPYLCDVAESLAPEPALQATISEGVEEKLEPTSAEI